MRWRFTLLQAVACWALGAGAQAAGVNTLPQVLISGSGAAVAVDEKPQSATEGQVLREQIEARPWLRPAEVLETVPGVVVTQHSGDGKANQYFLRGFNLDHGTDVSIYALGMPVNQRSHAHGQGYADLNFLIPELVDSLSYRKGPYLARDGDFATAGAVAIDYVSRVDAPFIAASVGQNGYRRLLAVASWDQIRLGESGTPGRLLLAAEVLGNDGPWTVPERLAKNNLVASYAEGDLNQGWRLTAMLYRAKWTATDQIPERAVKSGLIGEFDSLDPSSGGKTDLAALSWQANGLNHQGAWRASAYLARYSLDLYSNFSYATDAQHGDQFRQQDQRNKFGAELAQTWRYAGLGAAQSTTVGLQLRHDRIGPLGLQLTQSRQPYATVREDRVDETSLGGFIDQATQWNPWLRSHLGLRADQFRFKVRSDTPANSGDSQAHILSPKVALAFTPSQEIGLFANWGQGFHSNDARGTVISVDPDPRSGSYGQAVDRVTPLARATGTELGATWTTPELQLSAALWTLKLQSELVYVGDAGATEAGRPSLRRGVEFAAVWQPNKAWTLDADASFTRARFDDGDLSAAYIEGAVRRTFSAGLSYRPSQAWEAALRLRHIGPRQLNEDGSQVGAASTVLNAHFDLGLSRNWRVGLDVLNVSNTRFADMEYRYASQLPGEAAPVEDRHYHPGEPRSLRMTLKYSFH
ncbi:TonB-dependent receptor [Paucibacter sp. KCTC 42545]|uniref:TonB-dependent receptor n=1 Tax=Paucibacter sp. KCTC 42545 TaxID=1768242 RepID=UPI0018D2622B|nr:TonB-dependent receptor [Paucibacter sp. KCTC 42545]